MRFGCFIKNQNEFFQSLLALRSFSVSFPELEKPLLLAPEDFIIQLTQELPDLDPVYLVKKAGGKLVGGFPSGYNINIGFRTVLTNLARRSNGAPLLYFSPNTIFRPNALDWIDQNVDCAAFAPDDFWPVTELYGPTHDQIWASICEIGGGKLDDWMHPNQPNGYWRRYPNAYTGLFYCNDAKAFAADYTEINRTLISQTPETLQGQSQTYPEASLNATIVARGGKIQPVNWDHNIIAYRDFYDLILRLNDENWEWVQKEILEFSPLRITFKSFDELKIIFYQKRLTKFRDRFDTAERDFSILRMQQAINRRKIRRGVKKAISRKSEAESAQN